MNNIRVSIIGFMAGMAIHALGHAAGPAESLVAVIEQQDRAVFDAFNRCADPEQLKAHEAFFSASVEFYHDTGGVTWSRDAMLANTRQYACGKYRRELVAGSLRVYPIKDFGAIEQGTHRFCSIPDGPCDGLADFTMVWQSDSGQWRITRVLSYGHRAAHAATATVE